MSYKRGEIVWVKFPFSDSSISKFLPALIISNDKVNQSGDYLMMQVTSVIRKDLLSLTITEKDYKESALLKKINSGCTKYS